MADKRRTKDVYAVILVGGKGKRLRPLSTGKRPKAFLSITRDRKTMFKRTLERIRKIILPSHIIVVANVAHSHLVKRDLPRIGKNLLLEPVSRNTAPAITFAALTLKKRLGNAVMFVVQADQYIKDERPYLDSIKIGIDFVFCNNDALVVFGLKPAFPATEYGYIQLQVPSSKPRARHIYKVRRFLEKPDLNKARKFLKDGSYLWNTGAFVFTAETIFSAMKRFVPEIISGFADLNSVSRGYKKLPDISIDYAVMEKADNIHCVKGSYQWQDVGSFKSLKEVLRRESRAFIEHSGKITKII